MKSIEIVNRTIENAKLALKLVGSRQGKLNMTISEVCTLLDMIKENINYEIKFYTNGNR